MLPLISKKMLADAYGDMRLGLTAVGLLLVVSSCVFILHQALAR